MRKIVVTLACLIAIDCMGIVLGLLIKYYDNATKLKIISFFVADIIIICVCMYYLAQEWDPEEDSGSTNRVYEAYVPEHEEIPQDDPPDNT